MRSISAAVIIAMLIWVGTAFAQSIPTWPEFTLSQRGGLTFPIAVPTFRGTTTNTITSLDISPNGNPAEIAYHGFSWLDVCDKDLTTVSGGFHCARVAISSQGARIGILNFNSAAPLPILIISNNITIAKFSLDASGAPKLIVGTTDVMQEIIDLKARVYALEH